MLKNKDTEPKPRLFELWEKIVGEDIEKKEEKAKKR